MFKIDFREQYKRVLTFNQKIGKLPSPVTQMDIYAQQRLVDEEVGEWLEELAKEHPEPNMLKELCDVFVTMSYLDFLQLMEIDEEISVDKASEVMYQVWNDEAFESLDEDSYRECAKNIKEMSNLKLMLLGAAHSLIDIKAALDEVLDNNDLKVYETISEADEQMVLLGDEAKYFVDCNTFGGRDYFCIKRIEDRKVMKALNHPKVNLAKFLGKEE